MTKIFPFAVRFSLLVSCMILAIEGQSQSGKWELLDPLDNVFVAETNTFVQTFQIDESLNLNNTVGEVYDRNCTEGGSPLYNKTHGILNPMMALAGGNATFSFEFDFDILREDLDVFNYTDPDNVEMTICTRFILESDDPEPIMANYQETLITIYFDLSAGLTVEDFNVEAKNNLGNLEESQYDAIAYLCDPNDPSVALAPDTFSQGSIIGVCVTPTEQALEDGLLLYSLDSFIWSRDSVVEQPAIENGNIADNGLTVLNCPPFSVHCTFTSLLFSDFYRPTDTQFFSALAEVEGIGTATLSFDPSRRRELQRTNPSKRSERERRILQRQENSLTSEIGMTIDISTKDDDMPAIRLHTADSNSSGVEAKRVIWVAATFAIGMFLGLVGV